MASRYGAAKQTWSNYERGDRSPSLDVLSQIGDSEGVDLHWLLTGEGEMRRGILALTGAGKSEAALAAAPPEEGIYQAQPVGFEGDDRATVRIPIYATPLQAGPTGPVPSDEIVSYGRVWSDWLQHEVRIAPERAFMAPVRGDSMRELLHDGDYVLGQTQDHVDIDGIYALVLNDALHIKHVRPGRKRGDLTLVSQNVVYPAIEVSTRNGDDLHIIGRVMRRIIR